jgi:hypothetical protein
MKHTPGPWNEVTVGNQQRLIVSEANGTNVAVSYDKKDARLIAAAPELLESCKEWLDIWIYIRDTSPNVEIPDTFNGSTDACGRLRASIAKAEGRE